MPLAPFVMYHEIMTTTKNTPDGHIVGVVSIKGGVGKTTLYDELAFGLARYGRRVATLLLDNQEGALHPTGRVDTPEVTLIDTPGRIDAQIEKIIPRMNTVIVPVEPSRKSLAVMGRNLAHVAENATVIVVVNGYDSRLTSHRSVLSELTAQYDTVLTVPRSVKIEQAYENGRSVVDMFPTAPVAYGIQHLVNTINALVDQQ